MPNATIDAFLDHGTVRRTVDEDVEGARRTVEQLAEAGVDLDDVTRQLEIDGVEAFIASFDSLGDTIKQELDRMGARGAA
jgi:transaldolase